MFEKRDQYKGASFVYESEACNATGNFRTTENGLSSLNVNGSVKIGADTFAFRANKEEGTQLAIAADPVAIEAAAAEVVIILQEINAEDE